MITVRITGDFPDLSKKIRQGFDKIADDVSNDLKNATPVDTGYAKSRWKEKKGVNSTTINNDAPYINELEKGRSKQAPNGMIKPMVEKLKRNLNKGKYFK